MSQTMTFTGKLTITSCWCGMTYAIPEGLYSYAESEQQNGRKVTVYCPLGHQWVIAGESDLSKERRARERLERQLACRDEDLRAERASHAATKGQVTKLKKRAKAGVCPVPGCKRSFTNMADHVSTCHPDYQPSA